MDASLLEKSKGAFVRQMVFVGYSWFPCFSCYSTSVTNFSS